MNEVQKDRPAHLVLASSSDSNVFCRCNSSISVTVTAFSRSSDSFVVIGDVTPRYLSSERWFLARCRTATTHPCSVIAVDKILTSPPSVYAPERPVEGVSTANMAERESGRQRSFTARSSHVTCSHNRGGNIRPLAMQVQFGVCS